jgi:hypothetical protein
MTHDWGVLNADVGRLRQIAENAQKIARAKAAYHLAHVDSKEL